MHINFVVQQNEASALTRGGRPTKLFDVVDLILKNGGSVRGKDLKPLFPQLPALYSLLKSEPGLVRDTTGAFPTLAVSDDLYQRYVAACKEMNRPYYDQKGVQQGAPTGTPATPAPAQEPAASEEPPAEPTHWWKYTFKNDKCEFKCSPTKITIKRKARDGVKTSTIRKGSARSDLYDAVGISAYSYEHDDLDKRLGIAVKVMLYAGYSRIEYEEFKPNRENILHLTECLDGVFGVPANYWKPTEAGCLAKIKSLIKKRVADNDYGSIVLNDVTLSGKTLDVNVEFYKKAYGDSYDRNYYGRWTFNDLSEFGSRHSTEYPENAWWDGTTSRDTPSGVVQKLVFFDEDADKKGATPNYFALIADEICITEYLSAD